MEVLQRTNPAHYQRLNKIKLHDNSLKQLSIQSNSSNNNGILTIPVIVHVIWNTSVENISDAQIESQIDVLNEDFRRNNADASNTPSQFTSVAADVEIEFVLSEVIRKNTTKTSFSIDDSNFNGVYDLVEEQTAGIKFDTYGSAAVSTDSYLNIWVCDLPGFLGYGQFPGGESSTDGVVISYDSFGRTGTLSPPYDEGRTATHEVGHWLNLNHIWGYGVTSCSDTDNVNDTPNQEGPTYHCPSHPSSSCSSNDMFMNYMDYTDDACMNLFTTGQKDRMRAIFSSGGARESIINCDILISNTNINSNESIEECNVELNNVTISNGADVQIKASENLTIDGTFDAQFGTTLNIDNN